MFDKAPSLASSDMDPPETSPSDDSVTLLPSPTNSALVAEVDSINSSPSIMTDSSAVVVPDSLPVAIDALDAPSPLTPLDSSSTRPAVDPSSPGIESPVKTEQADAMETSKQQIEPSSRQYEYIDDDMPSITSPPVKSENPKNLNTSSPAAKEEKTIDNERERDGSNQTDCFDVSKKKISRKKSLPDQDDIVKKPQKRKSPKATKSTPTKELEFSEGELDDGAPRKSAKVDSGKKAPKKLPQRRRSMIDLDSDDDEKEELVESTPVKGQKKDTPAKKAKQGEKEKKDNEKEKKSTRSKKGTPSSHEKESKRRKATQASESQDSQLARPNSRVIGTPNARVDCMIELSAKTRF